MRYSVILSAALALSCSYDLGSNDLAASEGDALLLDEGALLALAADRDYAAHGLVLVTPQPIASAAIAGATISVWVSASHAEEYRSWQGDRTLPVASGTVVVREVYDASGALGSVTLLAKARPGYNPAVSDLWFAKTDANGDVVEDDQGEPLVGRVGSCGACHLGQGTVGGLFGLPDRVAH